MNLDKEIFEISIDDIMPNRFQPREIFDDNALQELSKSIKEHGVIQPIIVRKVGDKYEIIAGERRYRASKLAGKTTIPAIVKDLDDREAAKVALLENLQRKDLTPIEEARTYQTILKLDNMTQEELATNLGKSQSTIANKLRLLQLDDEVQTALLNEKISERHARSLLNITDKFEQRKMLNLVITNRMTVKQLDDEIAKVTGKVVQQDDQNNNDLVSPQSIIKPIVLTNSNFSNINDTMQPVSNTVDTVENKISNNVENMQNVNTTEQNKFQNLQNENKTIEIQNNVENMQNVNATEQNKFQNMQNENKTIEIQNNVENMQNVNATEQNNFQNVQNENKIVESSNSIINNEENSNITNVPKISIEEQNNSNDQQLQSPEYKINNKSETSNQNINVILKNSNSLSDQPNENQNNNIEKSSISQILMDDNNQNIETSEENKKTLENDQNISKNNIFDKLRENFSNDNQKSVNAQYSGDQLTNFNPIQNVIAKSFKNENIIDNREKNEQLHEIQTKTLNNNQNISQPTQVLTNNEQFSNIYDLRFAINNVRQAIQNTEKFGFKITTEEQDLENTYQIVIKIDKNK